MGGGLDGVVVEGGSSVAQEKVDDSKAARNRLAAAEAEIRVLTARLSAVESALEAKPPTWVEKEAETVTREQLAVRRSTCCQTRVARDPEPSGEVRSVWSAEAVPS